MVSRDAFVIGFVKGVMVGSLLGGLALTVVSIFTGLWLVTVIGLIIIGISAYSIFEDSMNLVQTFGPVYWSVRQIEARQRLWIGRVRMKESDYPWHRGQGIEVRWRHHGVQVGVCRRKKMASEEEGLLDTIDGRNLDIDPQRIGREWQ